MNILDIIAPNTAGAIGGQNKGGKTGADKPFPGDPSSMEPAGGSVNPKPSTSITGTQLMPIQDPMNWAKIGAGNFAPGSTSKGAALKMMGDGGGQ